MDLVDKCETAAELDAVEEFGNNLLERRLLEAVEGFKAGTQRFLNVTDKILKAIDALDKTFVSISPIRNPLEAPALSKVIGRLSEALRLFHDDQGMRKTQSSNEEVDDLPNDENVMPPVLNPVNIPADITTGQILEGPVPSTSRKFEELADEYVKYFVSTELKSGRLPEVKKMASKALANKGRYEAAGNPLGIPWWFIAGIHLLESTYNFSTHLHNGDPLSGRTFRVPSGRPISGNPPFSWEESARDALTHQNLNTLSDWSLPRALWRWERYNGFGYRSRRVPTPYLWSFTSIYTKGKFVGDGAFSKSAVSKQCGCAALLKYLHNEGHVDLKLDILGEDETNQPDSDVNAEVIVADNLPNIDNNIPPEHPFQAFFAEHLPNVRHFEWHEFLVKGASHSVNGLNTDPPFELWENVIPLVLALDEFREQVGHPVILTSVYRSPKYNARIGGATRSQHMVFTAADFKVVGAGAGSPNDWASRMRQIRQSGIFEGGIGTYPTFVHADVRGTRANF
ncbi:MAG: D-Ala-D-Ala carboxypeptidase family metallohydrolase [Roseibium sp.]